MAECCPLPSGESELRIAGVRSAGCSKRKRRRAALTKRRGTRRGKAAREAIGTVGRGEEGVGEIRSRTECWGIGHNGVTRLCHADISRNTLNDPGDLRARGQRHKGRHRRKRVLTRDLQEAINHAYVVSRRATGHPCVSLDLSQHLPTRGVVEMFASTPGDLDWAKPVRRRTSSGNRSSRFDYLFYFIIFGCFRVCQRLPRVSG